MDDRERLQRAMAGIGLAVGAAAVVSPRALLRAYGVPASELTGAGAFGWRLFGVRNLVVGVAALRGDASARKAFLPTQLADQAVFAHAYRTRAVPRPAALGAMVTSGAIVALDLRSRR